MTAALDYALVTPVRDEAQNLPRLLGCITAQTARPRHWVIVDTGSTDGTPELVAGYEAEHDWIELRTLPGRHELNRGAPVVIGIHAGVRAVAERATPDVVVKLDADLSFAPDYFERLIGAFATDSTLGIASGTCLELENGVWVEQGMGGRSVWGASRAYRWTCLEEVFPLEERMGWDGIDQLKANMRGWETRILHDLPFHHHRQEGERDGARRVAWASAGEGSHYMGYRFPFLVARALRHAREEPSALAMIWGYCAAAVRREPRCPDEDVRAYLREQQRLTHLPQRVRESLSRS